MNNHVSTVLSKSFFTLLLLVTLSYGLVSCEEDIEQQVDADTLEVANDMVVDLSYDDLDGMAFSAMIKLFTDSEFATDRRISCADITVDAVNQVITIDFKNGCRGHDNRLRKGVVRIGYSGWILAKGGQIRIEPDNYYVDAYKVEGIRTLVNITEEEGALWFEVLLEEGRVVWPDQTHATLEGTFFKEWRRGTTSPTNDEYRVYGSGEGKNRAGKNYLVTIQEPSALTVRVACLADRVNVPVRGIKKYESEGRELSIDYGTGQCNYRVIIRYNGFALEANLAGKI
jgi:hypothetical protein